MCPQPWSCTGTILVSTPVCTLKNTTLAISSTNFTPSSFRTQPQVHLPSFLHEKTVADIIFHFHQELPKLLRGYHQCTREEAAILAALIYRVKHAETKVDIASVLKSLLPADLIKSLSSYEWKKEIARAYNKDSGMSTDEAKIAFLKVIY